MQQKMRCCFFLFQSGHIFYIAIATEVYYTEKEEMNKYLWNILRFV